MPSNHDVESLLRRNVGAVHSDDVGPLFGVLAAYAEESEHDPALVARLPDLWSAGLDRSMFGTEHAEAAERSGAPGDGRRTRRAPLLVR